MNTEHYAEAIRSAGFRATKQRLALVLFLSKIKYPLHIREIAGRLRPSIDPVTVYRMADAFKKAGLVREVNLRGDHPRYELNDGRDHHHIICTGCGRVEDFTDKVHEKVGKYALAKSKTFKKITGHSFDLYGVCKTCVT